MVRRTRRFGRLGGFGGLFGLLGGNDGLGLMTRGLLVAGLLVAVTACGGKDKPSASSTGTSSGLRIVSQPVRNAQVGERMKYQAVLSKGGDAVWSMGMAPPGATIDEGGNVVWMPTGAQGGPQSFTVQAKMGGVDGVGGEQAEQTFVVSSAVAVMQAHGDVDPGDPNGATVSVDAPLSPAHGAAMQMEPGALPPGPPVAMTISSVEYAPLPPMAVMTGVKADDLRPVDFGPTGLAFKKPVRIQLPMSAAVLAKGRPVIQTYDYDTGTWHKLKPLSVDLTHGIVIAETQHFSTYVVVPDVKAIDLTLGLGGANSACPDRLVVRAPLALAFADIPAAVVNGYAGGAANVADLLGDLPDGQALQVLIRVSAQPLSGDGAQSGWLLGAASKLTAGKFKVTVTSDSHTGSFLKIPAEVAAADLESWLNGSRVDFVFSALGAVAGGAAAQANVSLYMVAAADADRPPPRAANVFASEEITEAAPAAGNGSDDDCDGAPNAWDPDPTGVAPPVVVGLPPGPVHVTVGASVSLKVASSQAGTRFTWGAADPTVSVVAADSSALVRPSAPGQFQVWVSGEADGAARFGWEIIADPAAVQNANTPPFVAISASASLVRVGQSVLLTALTHDAEQSTITTAWSASESGTLLGTAGNTATFLANAPGDYLVTCVGNDGIANSPPGRITISVVSVNTNLAPSVPSVSPMSPALQHASGAEAKVDLVALASDPEAEPVTYEYAPDPQTPPTFTLLQAGPKATFSSTQNGTYVFYVTATDSHGARGPWTPVKIQVLPTLLTTTSVDADKDGYPAGFDCNDADPKVFPGAKELCGDGIDQNCDGRDQPSTECDADGDRFSPATGDCDDKNPARSPAAIERCDGIDNNCNSIVDEGFMIDVACAAGVGACQAAGKTVCNAAWTGVVCGATAGTTSAEICDGLDNDCNGRVDDVAGQRGEGAGEIATATDLANCGGCGIVCPARNNSVAACVGGGCASSCVPGYVDTDGNRDNGCECRLTNGGVETCDGLDNDCNGVVDDGGGATYYDGPAATASTGVCRVGTKVCKGGQLAIAQPARGPSTETCDGLDNDCNGKVDDGFELSNDPRNCGGCGLACPAGVACLLGKCGNGGTGDPTAADAGVRADSGTTTTMPPFQGDGGIVDGGNSGTAGPDAGVNGGNGFTVCSSAAGPVCADLMNDNANCGGCGRACAATDRCFAGVCQSGASTCPAPKAWCADAADPAKMYCTDPMSDPRNCGACLRVCPAGVPCQMGVCQGTTPVTACPSTAPFGCPTPDGAMICSDLKYDPANCGGCGKACAAGVACQGGLCGTQMCPAAAPTQCPTPTGDVCANLAVDLKNCGRCGLICPAGVACDKGVCGGTAGTMCPPTAPSVCPGPQGPVCTNLGGDAMNCGNCGVICPAGGACVNAMCGGGGGGGPGAPDGGTGAGGASGTSPTCPAAAPATCPAPDGTIRCTDLMRDPGNCAMCGRVCPAGTQCLSGVCSTGTITCPAPLMACPGGCMDVTNDPGNCGRCGNGCPAGSACQNGTCGGALTCVAPLVMCRDATVGKTYCTDPNRDPGNCGGCGKTCPANAICTAGICQGGGGGTFQGLGACPGPNGAPLCVNLLGDAANCGACGRVCPAPLGCYGGVCGDAAQAQMCPPELKTCPDPTGKSYCANVLGDPGNCGACGRICPAGAACMNGICGGGTATTDGGVPPTISCPAALYPCGTPDGLMTCVDLINDSKNCGGCGLACPATQTCQQKICR